MIYDDYNKEINKLNFLTIVRLVVCILLALVFVKFKIYNLLFTLNVIMFIFFIIGYFATRSIYRDIYAYLSGEKKFSFRSKSISKDRFLDELKNGILPNTYIKVNGELHLIEVKKKYYFVDFKQFKNIDEMMNYKISGTTLNDLEKIMFVSFNGDDPKYYL